MFLVSTISSIKSLLCFDVPKFWLNGLINSIAKLSLKEKKLDTICESSSFINIHKNNYSIDYLAQVNNKSSAELVMRIKEAQQYYKEKIWNDLCKEHPVVVHYEHLKIQSFKAQGYERERYRKKLETVAADIITNKK